MVIAKAVIHVIDWSAIDLVRGLPKEIPVQFNPTEYTKTKGAQLAEIAIPGIDSPIQQFIHGQTEKLTVELLYDTTRILGTQDPVHDVRTLTMPVYQLVKIQPKTHAPPRVRFIWGLGLAFKGIVESIQRKFTLISPSGMPVRASLTVTFREYKSLEDQLTELNLQSSDHTKRHLVKRGETLSTIAAVEYGDPTLWRVIARANEEEIRNPRQLTPGATLLLPPLDQVETEGVDG